MTEEKKPTMKPLRPRRPRRLGMGFFIARAARLSSRAAILVSCAAIFVSCAAILVCCAGAKSETPLLKDIVIGDDDDGKSYAIYKGSLAELRLSGNATTGFLWEIDPATDNDLVLKPQGEAEYRADAPGRPGAGGTTVFSYMAAVPGTAVLVFRYRRPWETEAAEKTFRVTVLVKDVH